MGERSGGCSIEWMGSDSLRAARKWTHLIVTWVVTGHARETQHVVQLAHRVRERRGEELSKPRLGACVALSAMYETADLRVGRMGGAMSAWEPGVLATNARGTGRAARNILRGAAR
jgi:hypothetical protein